MRCGSAWFLGLAGAALTNALVLEKRDSPAVLAVPVVSNRDNSNSRRLSKRSNTVGIDFLRNATITADTDPFLDVTEWKLNFTLGTPPQPFEGYLDTLSNGFWVVSQNGGCDDDYYCDDGRYDLSNSSTGKKLDESFTYNYYDTPLEGVEVTDVLKIGDTKLDNMTFAVVNGSRNASTWIENNIGIGYGNETSSATSLTQALADSGAINSAAVSLWNGTILFGGVNKAKYEGDLYAFDTVMGNSSMKALRINMDGISINGSSDASDEFPLDAIFSISDPLTYVPKSVARSLASKIGVTNVPDDYGQFNFSCKSVPQDTTITFKFGKLDFEFDLSSFISGYYTPLKPGFHFSEEDNINSTCYFDIVANTYADTSYGASIWLGANFISRVYSVFDLENDQILLAKRNTDDAADDIVEISSGKNGVPGAKGSAGTRVGGDLSMTALVAATAMLIMSF